MLIADFITESLKWSFRSNYVIAVIIIIIIIIIIINRSNDFLSI